MRYLTAISIEIANVREYFSDWLAGIAAYPFQLAALWLVWSTLFRVSATGSLGEYNQGEIIAYYFGVIILGRVVGAASGVENVVWQDIIRGGLDYFLVRPISYPGMFACRTLGKALITMAFGIPVLVAYLFISGHGITIVHLVAFILMALAGVMIYFLTWFLFGMLSFRMVRIFGIRDITWTVVAFLSGATLPLDLMPGVIQKFSVWMPLRYIYFDPLAMLLGRRTFQEILSAFGIMSAWITVLIVVAFVLWQRGVKIYESAGG